MKDIISRENLLLVLGSLSNPVRLRIISALHAEKNYVSQLARELEISRPLLYLHLQKLEEAELIQSSMEISDTGKALKYYALKPFHLEVNGQLIYDLISVESKGEE